MQCVIGAAPQHLGCLRRGPTDDADSVRDIADVILAASLRIQWDRLPLPAKGGAGPNRQGLSPALCSLAAQLLPDLCLLCVAPAVPLLA